MFDFWLAEVVKELGILWPFWNELFEHSGVDDALGRVPADRLKKPLHYIEHPKEVRIFDYGFHEVVARGLARGPMFDNEFKKLILEYLTPSEVKEYDVPITRGKEKIEEPERIAYRRFAKSKGIDPGDYEAAKKALSHEAWRRFKDKERKWPLPHQE